MPSIDDRPVEPDPNMNLGLFIFRKPLTPEFVRDRNLQHKMRCHRKNKPDRAAKLTSIIDRSFQPRPYHIITASIDRTIDRQIGILIYLERFCYIFSKP